MFAMCTSCGKPSRWAIIDHENTARLEYCTACWEAHGQRQREEGVRAERVRLGLELDRNEFDKAHLDKPAVYALGWDHAIGHVIGWYLDWPEYRHECWDGKKECSQCDLERDDLREALSAPKDNPGEVE